MKTDLWREMLWESLLEKPRPFLLRLSLLEVLSVSMQTTKHYQMRKVMIVTMRLTIKPAKVWQLNSVRFDVRAQVIQFRLAAGLKKTLCQI